ncbi:MAG: hypothetical protein LBG11_11520 [Bifidobacteriaceae bacterium]|jgi:antitoxin (DNA-binding transcriptional repressor) of toxin-antitoxin stability system|nr:hypothetical protein [Bifidobacteriaceae bacterium]
MQTVGIKEFRADLAEYLGSGELLKVTRHGEVIGLFVPQGKRREFDPERLRASGARLDAQLKEHGIDPEDLIREFDQLKRQPR